MKRSMGTSLWRFTAVASIFIAVLGFGSPPDKDKGAARRTVQGIVVDGDENAIPSAIVYLQKVGSNTIESRIADDQGKYTFGSVDPNADYELHAEHDDMTSSTHRISSFDTRLILNIELKIDHQKAPK